MAITQKQIAPVVTFVKQHPIAVLVAVTVLLIGGLLLASGAITTIRYSFGDAKVEKLELKTDKAIGGMNGEISEANKAAQERAIEDAIRERTIKPEIQRTTRNLEEARSRTRAARNDYENARKQTLGDDSDARALHERNCADLRDLYPGESIPLCDQ